MIDPISKGARGQGAPSANEPVGRSIDGSVDGPKGAAFRALLERLAQSAKDLESASSEIRDPRELGRVVENARASVEEAVMLGSDLLEAYRASQAHAEKNTSPPIH